MRSYRGKTGWFRCVLLNSCRLLLWGDLLILSKAATVDKADGTGFATRSILQPIRKCMRLDS